jgi:hypothetical protein
MSKYESSYLILVILIGFCVLLKIITKEQVLEAASAMTLMILVFDKLHRDFHKKSIKK